MNLNLVVLFFLVIAAIVLFFFVGSAISLWVQALVSGAQVGLLNIVFMRFRKVPAKLIVESKIMAVKAGLDIHHGRTGIPLSGRRQRAAG